MKLKVLILSSIIVSSLYASSEQFIDRLYSNILNRTADTSGMNHWKSKVELTNASEVALSFFNSTEFLSQNYNDSDFVEKAYLTFFNRYPDNEGNNHWISRIYNGTPRSEVIENFAQSSEFSTLARQYGIAAFDDKSVSGFAERFYTKVLGRNSDVSGLNNWKTGLENGTKSATDIANGFFFSSEYVSKYTSNSDFLDTAYQVFFDREADVGGKDNWMNKLYQAVSRQEIIASFIASAEFKNVAENYGIATNKTSVPTENEVNEAIHKGTWSGSIYMYLNNYPYVNCTYSISGNIDKYGDGSFDVSLTESNNDEGVCVSANTRFSITSESAKHLNININYTTGPILGDTYDLSFTSTGSYAEEKLTNLNILGYEATRTIKINRQ